MPDVVKYPDSLARASDNQPSSNDPVAQASACSGDPVAGLVPTGWVLVGQALPRQARRTPRSAPIGRARC